MAHTTSAHRKQKYADAKVTTEKNREIKRRKHMKKYPNDMQTAKLVK